MVNERRLVKLFQDLVTINSHSGDEKNVRKFLKAYLLKMGLDVLTDKKGNLYTLLKGKKKKKTLLFSAHMDTVQPGLKIKPVLKKGRIRSAGKTILGSDDKSGIAEIIEMLHIVKEKKLKTPNILVIFTVEEEIGLRGARQIKKVEADYGFVLDSDGPIGTVVTKAPSHITFKAIIKGISAHAGIAPESGINAITAAAKAIAACPQGRIDKDTVANIGVIKGGRATNIVPDQVMVRGEARSHKNKKVNKQIKAMQAAFKASVKKMKAKVTFIPEKEYNRFDINHETKLLKKCNKAAKNNGFKLRIKSTGGGSDANIFNKMGIPTAVLSTGMQKVHTTEECILVKDMVAATRFLVGLVCKKNRG